MEGVFWFPMKPEGFELPQLKKALVASVLSYCSIVTVQAPSAEISSMNQPVSSI